MIEPIPGFSTRLVWIAAIGIGVFAPAFAGDAELVRELIADGRYARAAEQARRALDDLGPCAPERVEIECLCGEAMRRVNGRYAPETLVLAEHAVRLATELHGADDARTAEPLLQLGVLRCARREWAEAKPALERALELFRDASAGKDPRQALALAYLSSHPLSEAGGEKRALAQLDEADRILDRLAPDDGPARAWILDMRGNVLNGAGQMEEAGLAFARAVAIRRDFQRGDHPMLASSLRNLGGIQDNEGRLAEARASYQEALVLFTSGAEISWAPADLLNRLGFVCRDLGDAEHAQAYLTEALADLRSRDQGDSALAAASLDMLARLAFERGDLESALHLAEDGLSILEKLPAADPVERIQAVLFASELRVRSGHVESGCELLAEARAVEFEGGGGAWSARCDQLEAWIALWRGDLQRAKEIYVRLLGADPAAGTVGRWVPSAIHDGLARAAFRGGEFELALSESLESGRLASEEWAHSALGLEEVSAIGFEEGPFLKGLDVAAESAARLGRAEAAERFWNALLLSSDRVYRECAERLELVRSAATAEVAGAGARLADARLRLAGLYVRSRRSADSDEFLGDIQRARSDREAAERELAAEARISKRSRAGVPDVRALRGDLSAGTGLVRFCVATRPASDSACASSAEDWQSGYYACVLDARTATPRVLDLGSKDVIDDLVLRLRKVIETGAGSREYVPIAAELRRRVLDPVLSAMPGVRLLLLVPEGDLHLLPFPALCTESGRYLAESGPILHVLASETDLLPPNGPVREGSGLLALGDPDFSAASDATPDRIPGDRAQSVLGSDATRSRPALVAWPPLPESRTEIESVAASWTRGPFAREKVDLLRGSAASERAFRRSVPGRRVVHVATHGYYESAPLALGDGRSRGLSPVGALEISPAAALRRTQIPLLRSGLVFSGASANAPVNAPDDDGILTTEEVLGLDLAGVEWVVLSACDSGLGELRGAAGVLGLRRAFRMAGARTVIASLWPVEDRWAREWMESLYRARFVDRLSTAESVLAASLDVLSKLRKEGLEPLPRLWASFVAVGDWH